MTTFPSSGATCPIPLNDYPNVQLGHGGGGRLMNDLISRMFAPAFDNPALAALHDGAVLTPPSGQRMAFATDSYVVQPLFFPGSDIGELAINGTVNDLSMCGAVPHSLSCGFIIEEGFPMADLWRVVESMRQAAVLAGVHIVTGDTKVVDKGKGDGIFINTAGVGWIPDGVDIGPHRLTPGDVILLSGDIGRHGMAIMAQREGLEFETTIESDCAPLNAAVAALLAAGIEVHTLRDLTRGGLASALAELAEGSGWNLHIDQQALPVLPEVRGACELLGLDPLYVANEGRMIAIVPADQADAALKLLRGCTYCEGATRIGEVRNEQTGRATQRSVIGTTRIIDQISGEQLPRIC